MRIEGRSPLTKPTRWERGPIRHYHVIFWRQARAAEGIQQEQMMWAADENDVFEAADVHEVIAWADQEARHGRGVYTLYAVVTTPEGEGTVWLAGTDPTIPSPAKAFDNFERQHPPGVDPVGGSEAEVYS